MRITKKTESLFEIQFDALDVQNLRDIEDIFEIAPSEVIHRTLTESLRLGMNGVHNLLDVVAGKGKGKNGNEDPDNR